jgi:hypothetical protein
MGSTNCVDAQRRLLELGTDGFFERSDAEPRDIDEWQTQMQLADARR